VAPRTSTTMKYSKLLLAIAVLAFSDAVSAQILINSSGSYSQNFDALPLAGTSNAWSDNLNLAGWYADKEIGGEVTVISAGTGSSTATSLYSFGSTSSTERALGALSSGTSGAFAYGVVFQNTSALEITFNSFSYRGELWRMGSPAEAETLEFGYRISTAPITSALSGTWTDVNALDFTNPNPATPATTGAIDGNLAGNFVNLSANLNVSLAAGSYLMFRWYDIDHGGADNGLGIDDVAISYVTNAPVIIAVPEPSTYGLVAAALLIIGGAYRRWKACEC